MFLRLKVLILTFIIQMEKVFMSQAISDYVTDNHPDISQVKSLSTFKTWVDDNKTVMVTGGFVGAISEITSITVSEAWNLFKEGSIC